MEIIKLLEDYLLSIEQISDNKKRGEKTDSIGKGLLSFIEKRFPELSSGDNRQYFAHLEMRLHTRFRVDGFYAWLNGDKNKNVYGMVDWLKDPSLKPALLSALLEKKTADKEPDNVKQMNQGLDDGLKRFNVPAILYLYTLLSGEDVPIEKKVQIVRPENAAAINDSFYFFSKHGLNCQIFQDEYMEFWKTYARSQLKEDFRKSERLDQFLDQYLQVFFKYDQHFLKKKNIDFFKDFGLAFIHQSYGMIVTRSIYNLFHEKTDFALPFEHEHFYKKVLNCTYLNLLEADSVEYTSTSKMRNTLVTLVGSFLNQVFNCKSIEAEARAKVIISDTLRIWDACPLQVSPKVVLYLLVYSVTMEFAKLLGDNPLEPTLDNVASGLSAFTKFFGMDETETNRRLHNEMEKLTSEPFFELMKMSQDGLDSSDSRALELIKICLEEKGGDPNSAAALLGILSTISKVTRPIRKIITASGKNPELQFWEKLPEHIELFVQCCQKLVEAGQLDGSRSNPFEEFSAKAS